MAKYVEIGGLIKKGLSHSIVETEILTVIVKEKKSNLIFDKLYDYLKLSTQNNGVIYKFGTISKMST